MRLTLLSLLVLVGAVSARPSADLVSELRQGGYVLYLRHASLASPFCRTMETARLAFGKARATGDVRGGPVEASRYEALRKLLSSPVPKGTNRVISSHGNPFYALAGPPYLAEGEMALVKPEEGRFSVLGRLRVDDWPRLE